MIYERRKVAPLTDEDALIARHVNYLRAGKGRGVHAFYSIATQAAIDADIMHRLARTRRNNKRARAYADDVAMLVS